MSKVNRAMEMLKKDKIESIFISTKENVRYLSEYTGDDAYLFITSLGDKYLITDKRYTEQASLECPEFEVVNWRYDDRKVSDIINDLINEHKIKALAFEGLHISFDLYNSISQKSGKSVDLVPVKGYIEMLRYTKDLDEIDLSKKACEISTKALDKLYGFLKPGVTEKEATAELEYYMKKYGADDIGFKTILLSGSRTSLLHGIPSDRKIDEGDFVLIDFGAKCGGYICDMTRTVVVGRADNRQREVYELVQKAQQRALETMIANNDSKDTYKVIENIIAETEYMPYLYQGVGHGVGLFLHEEPFIGPNKSYIYSANSIVTIEPGIYIPGWGGIRIEDTVLIQENKQEILTEISKDLIEI